MDIMAMVRRQIVEAVILTLPCTRILFDDCSSGMQSNRIKLQGVWASYERSTDRFLPPSRMGYSLHGPNQAQFNEQLHQTTAPEGHSLDIFSGSGCRYQVTPFGEKL
jgi:hypothetical protein